MRVLTVATDYPPNSIGGAAFYAAEHNAALKRLGVHTDVLTTRPGPDRNLADTSALQYPTSPIPGWDSSSVLTDNVALLVELRQLIQDYDVINFHDVYASIAPLALRTHYPDKAFILTKHTGPTGPSGTTSSAPGPLEDYAVASLNDLERWCIAEADGVICVAMQMVDKCHALYGEGTPNRFAVCPPAIDSNVFKVSDTQCEPWCSHSVRILVPGRLSPRKRGDLAIDALSNLLLEDVCVAFVGAGPSESELRRRSKEQNVSDRVHFLPFVPQSVFPEMYAAASLVLAPSQDEAYAMVPLEARACGALLVASDIPGHSEQIVNGVDGLTFISGDVDSLVSTLRPVIRNREQWDGVASAGQVRASMQTWDENAERSRDFFERVLEGKRGSR